MLIQSVSKTGWLIFLMHDQVLKSFCSWMAFSFSENIFQFVGDQFIELLLQLEINY